MPGTASVTRAIKLLFLLILKSMHFNLMFSCLVLERKQQRSRTQNCLTFYDDGEKGGGKPPQGLNALTLPPHLRKM